MDHLPYSPSLAPSDFRLLEPSKKYLADKQFATDVNVKQAVTCLKLLKICKEMMLRRNNKRMTKSKEINCLHYEVENTEQDKQEKKEEEKNKKEQNYLSSFFKHEKYDFHSGDAASFLSGRNYVYFCM
jgi:hypothetical protein